jgi:hypothetical protein
MRARSPVTRALAAVGVGVGTLVMLMLSLLAGIGLLYALRHTGFLAVGPRVSDALPLLQLASRDAQPIGHVAVAWAAAGLVLGVSLVRIRPLRRTLVVAVLGLVLLLFASEASYALARNLRLGYVLTHRTPPAGAWVEALWLTVACALPRPLPAVRRRAGWLQRAARIPVPGKAV